jgi:sugar phosphate isomerase/epimerase
VTPPLEYIAAAAKAGFDGVGIRMFENPYRKYEAPTGNAPLLRDMKRALADTGVEFLDALSFYLQPDVDMNRFPAAFEASAELGAKYVLVIGDDRDWNRMRDNFGTVCGWAAKLGLKVSVEMVCMRQLHSLHLGLRIIRETGAQNATIVIDPVSFGRVGGNPADLKATDPKYFPYAQIDDGPYDPDEYKTTPPGELGWSEHCVLGEGNAPVRAILDALPPGIPLSVEIPVRSSAKMRGGNGVEMEPEAWAKHLVKTTRAYLADYYKSKQ